MSALAALPARAQAPATGGQLWSTGNLWIQLPSHVRILATGEFNDGTSYAYQQWTAGAGIGYQWKRLNRLTHMININSDKESRIVAGAGFEYVWTQQPGDATTTEDRVVVAATPRLRPGKWLFEDRNRVEFRWVSGAYSTRYRNRLTVERDVPVGSTFWFTPYASAEFFYDFDKGTWPEQQYAVGIQWPWKRTFMLETYYLFQHTTSAPQNVNVVGVTFNFYLRNGL